VYQASDNKEDETEELAIDGIQYDPESIRSAIADMEGNIAA
jgi:hypothetical protein